MKYSSFIFFLALVVQGRLTKKSNPSNLDSIQIKISASKLMPKFTHLHHCLLRRVVLILLVKVVSVADLASLGQAGGRVVCPSLLLALVQAGLLLGQALLLVQVQVPPSYLLFWNLKICNKDCLERLPSVCPPPANMLSSPRITNKYR